MSTLHLLVTFGLVVLIWLIQLLHYPSFRFVAPERFADFAGFHQTWISFVVMPLMLAELALVAVQFRLVLAVIVALVWASTFFLQVPCHQILSGGYDREVIERLISTNWIRTILWSIKFLILAYGFKWKAG